MVQWPPVQPFDTTHPEANRWGGDPYQENSLLQLLLSPNELAFVTKAQQHVLKHAKCFTFMEGDVTVRNISAIIRHHVLP